MLYKNLTSLRKIASAQSSEENKSYKNFKLLLTRRKIRRKTKIIITAKTGKCGKASSHDIDKTVEPVLEISEHAEKMLGRKMNASARCHADGTSIILED